MSGAGQGADDPKLKKSRIWATVKALFRARITAGLIVVLPIWVTYLLVRFVFELMRDASAWVVHALLPGERLEASVRPWLPRLVPDTWRIWLGMNDEQLAAAAVQWAIAIFSVFLTIFILYGIGLLTANIVGRRVLQTMDRLLDHVPFVKTVYRSIKQILAMFAGDQAKNLQRVALIPYPDENMRSVGFITNIFKDAVTGDELCSVFYATTPSPTTGYVFILKRSQLIEVDWTVEEAVKMVMSGGLLAPPQISLAPTEQQKRLARLPGGSDR